ncbi:MAG: hypothetical protein F4Y04_04565, partial [Chloroflexi bacterium]|nr:hypothetical protein [Chloroflexota bacterium]
MSEDHLLIERRDNGVVVATLNRPEVLNALSPRIRTGLREMAADLRGDQAARARVITGAGRGVGRGAVYFTNNRAPETKRNIGKGG